MKYTLTRDYRVDFTAFAPMHTFKGWCVEGITAEADIDFDTMTLHKIRANANVSFFTTGDQTRTRAMATYMAADRLPDASMKMVECQSFQKVKRGAYRISVIAVLEFMGIRKKMPITFYAVPKDDEMLVELAFQWSFKGHGVKAPRLLFLTVKDLVDIKGWGQFNQLKQPRDAGDFQRSEATLA